MGPAQLIDEDGTDDADDEAGRSEKEHEDSESLDAD